MWLFDKCDYIPEKQDSFRKAENHGKRGDNK